ncbi:MAG: 30S ribosomal protein S16 [Patescibacteria group bacterium]
MLTIKLRRVGKKKQPVFRLVVTEKGRDPWGDNLEIVGWMNPRTKEKSLEVERIKHWLSKGAQTTDTIHNLLVAEKIIEGDKRRSITISKVRQGKIDAKKPKPAEPKIEEAPKAEETTPAA